MSKIIFMGTPEFSVSVLEGLLKDPHYDIVAVVTQPDRQVGRKKELKPTPVKEVALKHHLNIYQPEKISGSKELEELIALEPDFIVTCAFGQFLPTKLLQAAKIYPVNVHASLLPKFRGGAPIHYAVMTGEKTTGVTIMEMEKKMDAGGIFAQKEIPILPTDDTGTLFEKLSIVGRDLLLETLPKILGGLKPVPQDESKATFSPNISKEQEKIDFSKPANEVLNHIRALYPFPGAYGLINETRIKIGQGKVSTMKINKRPGEIISITDHLLVACGKETVLEILTIQPAGKKMMPVKSFLLGQKILEIGMVFK